MQKLQKKTYILISIIIIVLAAFIGIYNYRKPFTLTKTFDEAIMTKPASGEVIKKTTVEIDAKVQRGLFRGSLVGLNARFVNKAAGKITIDDWDYHFVGITEKADFDSIMGTVYKDTKSTSEVFWFRMKELESIHLIGVGEGYDYHVIAEGSSK